MLNQITLKNFRQFEDRTFDFGAGNVTLRGPNEGGKTTVIEAFLYAIGGARQCRNADFVRWGAKNSQCKVEALMTLQGLPVRVKRGPSGAEVYAPATTTEPHVTGQTEVTSWFAEQLGTTMDVAGKMMFAGQKEIGGLLDENNGKVVEFIEDMSGLDIIEWLIEQIKAHGKTGDTEGIERSIAEAREALANVMAQDYNALMTENVDRLPALEQAEQLARAGVQDARAQVERCQGLIAAHQERDAAIRRAQGAVQIREEDLAVCENALAGLKTDAEDIDVAATRAQIEAADADYKAKVEQLHAETDKAVAAVRAAETEGKKDLEARVSQARQEYTAAKDKLQAGRARVAAFNRLRAYTLPESEWEGTRTGLEEFLEEEVTQIQDSANKVSRLQAQLSDVTTGLSAANAEALKLRKSVVELGQKCPTCHQVIPDAEGVEAHNAQLEADAQAQDNLAGELKARIDPLRAQIEAAQAEGQEAVGNAAEARKILSNPGFRLATDDEAQWIAFDENFVPARPSWIGEPPQDNAAQLQELEDGWTATHRELSVLAGQLTERATTQTSDLVAKSREAERDLKNRLDATIEPLASAVRRAEYQEQMLANAVAHVENSKAKLESAQRALAAAQAVPKPEGDPDTLVQQVSAYQAEERKQQDELAAALQSLTVVRTTIEHLEAQIKAQGQERARLNTAISNHEKDLAEIKFNSDLMSALAKARPVLANQLWNMVLKGVSTYLTTMRREPSIVERENKTFLINGKPYSSYSGSALDLLALGIRIALTKVFVPGASMMILDEPFAACSEERTLQSLSLITAAGFDQMVVITHESGTETVFDKVVEV